MLRTTNYKAKNILILSDIHGNYSALNGVFKNIEWDSVKGMILLGDLIDYGPSSNEVIGLLKEYQDIEIYCNIWGNHEQAIMTDAYDKFSSQRGKACAKHTKSVLSDATIQYLKCMNQNGKAEFMLGNKKCLAVHGSLEDTFWKGIYPGKMDNDYSEYDYVFSGHSHREHFFSLFYKIYKFSATRITHIRSSCSQHDISEKPSNRTSLSYIHSKVISIILLYSSLILAVPPESYTLYNNTPGHGR